MSDKFDYKAAREFLKEKSERKKQNSYKLYLTFAVKKTK